MASEQAAAEVVDAGAVARAEDIERRAESEAVGRASGGEEQLEAGLRRNEDAASSHPAA